MSYRREITRKYWRRSIKRLIIKSVNKQQNKSVRSNKSKKQKYRARENMQYRRLKKSGIEGKKIRKYWRRRIKALRN